MKSIQLTINFNDSNECFTYESMLLIDRDIQVKSTDKDIQKILNEYLYKYNLRKEERKDYFLEPEEAAIYLGIDLTRLDELINSNSISYSTKNGVMVFHVDELYELLRNPF